MLSQRTPKFDELLKDDVVNVGEFDVATFQTFFDVLMGFDQLNRDKSLIIFPVVEHHDIQDLMQKCIFNLKPTVMDEKVIHTLNIAINSDCEELIDTIIDFIMLYGVNRLFLQENFYLLLEPESVATLLRTVYRNPLILKSVVHWGKKYIEKNNVDADLRTFLSKYRILSKLSIDCLESPESLLQLCESNRKLNVFTETEVLEHLKKIWLKNQQLKYQWHDIRKGGTLSENFTLKHYTMLHTNIILIVQFNPTICDLMPMKEKNEDYYFEVTVTPTIYMNNLSSTTNSTPMSYKILPVENIGSTKTQLSVTIAPNGAYNMLKGITISYRFYRDCKVLKTALELSSPWNNPGQALLFTCNIDFA